MWATEIFDEYVLSHLQSTKDVGEMIPFFFIYNILIVKG